MSLFGLAFWENYNFSLPILFIHRRKQARFETFIDAQMENEGAAKKNIYNMDLLITANNFYDDSCVHIAGGYDVLRTPSNLNICFNIFFVALSLIFPIFASFFSVAYLRCEALEPCSSSAATLDLLARQIYGKKYNILKLEQIVLRLHTKCS